MASSGVALEYKHGNKNERVELALGQTLVGRKTFKAVSDPKVRLRLCPVTRRRAAHLLSLLSFSLRHTALCQVSRKQLVFDVGLGSVRVKLVRCYGCMRGSACAR